MGGKKKPDKEFKAKKSVTVLRDGTRVVQSNGRETQRGKYELNPTKSPKQIDITTEPGNQPLVLKGIYRLEGDILTLSYSGPNDERPKKLVSQEGTEIGVLKLKREKK